MGDLHPMFYRRDSNWHCRDYGCELVLTSDELNKLLGRDVSTEDGKVIWIQWTR